MVAGVRTKSIAKTKGKRRLMRFRLPANHRICFPDGAALIASSFKGFIGDLRPELF
jgi:hypothetical protein